jgi:nitrogen fixation protein NifU and related proteins
MAASNPLYHDIILEHYEYPRNKGTLEGADATSRGANALCGDDLLVQVKVRDGSVPAISWDGHACAIGEASASMMAESVEGCACDDARTWIKTVRGLLTGRQAEMNRDLDLGDVNALEGVRQYPLRIKCALLAWEALDEALTLAERKQNTNG